MLITKDLRMAIAVVIAAGIITLGEYTVCVLGLDRRGRHLLLIGLVARFSGSVSATTFRCCSGEPERQYRCGNVCARRPALVQKLSASKVNPGLIWFVGMCCAGTCICCVRSAGIDRGPYSNTDFTTRSKMRNAVD